MQDIHYKQNSDGKCQAIHLQSAKAPCQIMPSGKLSHQLPFCTIRRSIATGSSQMICPKKSHAKSVRINVTQIRAARVQSLFSRKKSISFLRQPLCAGLTYISDASARHLIASMDCSPHHIVPACAMPEPADKKCYHQVYSGSPLLPRLPPSRKYR